MAQDIFSQFEDKEEEDDPFASFVDEDIPRPKSVQSTPRNFAVDDSLQSVKTEPTFWQRIDEPLTDLPSRAARPVANMMDQPILNASPEGNDGLLDKLKVFNSQLRGFGAGAVQAVGDFATRMTSPLELGMTLATGGASIARRGGLMGLSRGLEAANLLGSTVDAGLGAKEIIQADDNSGRLSGLARIGGAGTNALGGLKGLKGIAENVPPAALPELETTALKTLKNEVVPEAVESPKLQLERQPVIQPQGSVNIDNTVDDMFNEALAARASEVPQAPRVPQKPKIRVKFNPETNSLEPDLNDSLTATVVKAAKTGEAVPQRNRIDPDTEVDLNDVYQGTMFQLESDYKPMTRFAAEGVDIPTARKMEDARQGEMVDARAPESELKAKGRAGDLTNANQQEFPGNFREPKEPEWMPGGKPVKHPESTKAEEVLGLTRALQSTFDLSFPLRQGRTLMHTKGWWNAWGDSIRSIGSEQTYKAVNDSIANRPNFRGRVHRKADGSIDYVEKSLAQEAGLYIGDLQNSREEALGSALAEKIPGIGRYVRGSNRAYNAFANKLRADVFDDLIAKNPHAKTDLVVARAIADYVNNASGRGNLGKFEAAAKHFNEMFFSPRLMKSRFHMMNPRNLAFSRPEVRNEYLKSMGLLASTWITAAKLAEYGGAEVSWDPESSDFGKIKIGNTRIDPGAGFQQPLVLMYRLTKGVPQKLLYGEGRYSESPLRTTGSDALNFLEGKLSPNARLISELASAEKGKKPFEVGDQALKSIMPITIQGFSELAQEDPDLLPLIGLDALGIGVSTYEKGKERSRLLPESIFPRRNDLSFPLR